MADVAKRTVRDPRAVGVDQAGKRRGHGALALGADAEAGDAGSVRRTGPFLVAIDDRGGRVSVDEARALGARLHLSSRSIAGFTRGRWPTLAVDGMERSLTDRGQQLANEWRRRYGSPSARFLVTPTMAVCGSTPTPRARSAAHSGQMNTAIHELRLPQSHSPGVVILCGNAGDEPRVELVAQRHGASTARTTSTTSTAARSRSVSGAASSAAAASRRETAARLHSARLKPQTDQAPRPSSAATAWSGTGRRPPKTPNRPTKRFRGHVRAG